MAGARARAAWALFDWAAQPYHTLITAFIFAPYFATRVAADPVVGQELWGFVQATTAFAIAVAAPLMGAHADRSGRLKPMLAVMSLFYVAGCLALWWAGPGALLVAALAVGVAGFAIEIAAVLTNAMLPRLAAPGRIGSLSGSAWALGFVGGLVALALTLAFIAPSGDGPRTLAGLEPAFGLSPGDGGPARVMGPFSALWYVVFAIPLFVFVPSSTGGGGAPSDGIVAAVRRVVRHRGLVRFLLARLAYQDALLAVFAFGGIYGAGVLGWETTELGLFGILLTVTGAIGAWTGGRLDDRLGAKPVVLASIVMCLVALGMIGFLEAPQAAASELFARTEDRIFLFAGTLVGIAAGPIQAASRTYLARVAPPDEIAAAFGVYALSGKAVAFTGPLLVSVATIAGGSQRAGLVPIAVLFVLGLAVLMTAPADRTRSR